MKRLLSLLTVAAFVATPSISIAQNSELVLEEVVVTATKKEENVQDIAPVSYTHLTLQTKA